MKKRVISFIVACAMMLALVATPLVASATTISANPSDDLQTLVSGANAGDTIDLGGNSFSVDVLTIDKSLTIQNGTINEVPSSAAPASTINITASNVTLQNLTIKGSPLSPDPNSASGADMGSNAIWINYGINDNLSGIKILNNKIIVGEYGYTTSGSVGEGIQNWGSGTVSGLQISGNTFSSLAGITYTPDRFIYLSWNIPDAQITGNSFGGTCNVPVSLDGASATVSGNTFNGAIGTIADSTGSVTSSSPCYIQLLNLGNGTMAPFPNGSSTVENNTFNNTSGATRYAVGMIDPSFMTSFTKNVMKGFEADSTGLIPVLITRPDWNPAIPSTAEGFDNTNGNNNLVFVKVLNAISYYQMPYTINWNANGGSPDQTTSVLPGDALVPPATPTPPAGYSSFKEWNTKADGTGDAFSSSMTAEDGMTFYAIWNKTAPTPVLYTVTLDAANGAVNPTSVTQATEGASVTLPTPTRDGYKFDGWYTSDGVKVTSPYTPTADITLYAKWTPNKAVVSPVTSFTVTFNSQGGSSVTSQKVAEGDLVTKPANPTRSGYTFAGWYTDKACTKAWNFTTDTVTADMTLYAKWTPVPVLVKTGDSTAIPMTSMIILLVAATMGLAVLRLRREEEEL